MKSQLIGMAGGSGAGKTESATKLAERYPELFSVISQDWYLKSREEMPLKAGYPNYNHPRSFTFNKLLLDLFTVTNSAVGEKIESLGITVKQFTVVEGCLILWKRSVRELLNYTLYLELDAEWRLRRRIHFMDDGYWDNVVIPMHEKYVEPTKRYADMTIEVGGMNLDEVAYAVEWSIWSFAEHKKVLPWDDPGTVLRPYSFSR